MDAPIITTTRDCKFFRIYLVSIDLVGSPIEFIPGLIGNSDKGTDKGAGRTWTYVNGPKWQREMLDTVYQFR